MKVLFVLCCLMLSVCFGEAPLPNFRPPAIPLITIDPFTQVWIRSSDATSTVPVYWNGTSRGMTGLIRIDSNPFRFLGTFAPPAPTQPARVLEFAQTDISPMNCDINDTAFALTPTQCNLFCLFHKACKAFVLTKDRCYAKSCVEPRKASTSRTSYVLLGESEKITGFEIANCDISKELSNTSISQCNDKCFATETCQAFVYSEEDRKCQLKSCTMPLIVSSTKSSFILKDPHPKMLEEPPALKQISVTVYPTRTVFILETPEGSVSKVRFTVTYLTTLFAGDLDLLSRPIEYINIDYVSLDLNPHIIQVYLDITGEHCVDDLSEMVQWNIWEKGYAQGIKMGTVKQNVLGMAKDRMGINWGYLYLSGSTATSKQLFTSVGNSYELRSKFTSTGTLPSTKIIPPLPVKFNESMVITMAIQENLKAGVSGNALFVFGYDDIFSVYFFGQKQKGLWTKKSNSIEELSATAMNDFVSMLSKSENHDKQLLTELSSKGGDEYATLCALAYRQTLSALKLTWNDQLGTTEVFLKEISTNGDMNTVDVIFPASPMLLYTNPKLLEMLLLPVFRYANNETWVKFTNPFSPHQLGVFPIANATTKDQEPMPMENTGNMFLMLLSLIQHNGGDSSFFYPKYWNLLVSWADYLTKTLPYPENQLCTDDFTGSLINNTNLAAKGIVSLAAFAEICERVTLKHEVCAKYRVASEQFAKTWVLDTTEISPIPHSLMAFNVHNTWSLKYNLVWQKLLKLGSSPFENYETLTKQEITFYKSKANTYGPPLDLRLTYVKLDWLSWVALFEQTDTEFAKIINFIYRAANETPTRCSFTDLYWTKDAKAGFGCSNFVARPVVGALFARALL